MLSLVLIWRYRKRLKQEEQIVAAGYNGILLLGILMALVPSQYFPMFVFIFYLRHLIELLFVCIIKRTEVLVNGKTYKCLEVVNMAEKLTKRQKAVLDSIERIVKEKGYGPTVREICADLGLSSPSTVHVHLKTLEQKGYIVRDPLKSRSITLASKQGATQNDMDNVVSFSKIVDVPLVGNVAAGEPILAEENITDTISLPTDIVGDSASFMLSVHGESMIEAGINDGDYVVVKEQPVANNGDIVVAIIDDGATVKRFYRENGHIRLQPENSSMDPIITTDCIIAGKVVAVFRRL